MEQIATQMQALDEFVTRARHQNDQHHSAHVTSLDRMTTSAKDSYVQLRSHFTSSHERAKELGQSMDNLTSSLKSTLPSLHDDIQHPLSVLRSRSLETSLQEYSATGETPQKTTYPIPTTLPRTAPHEKLLNKLSSPQKQRSPSKSRSSPSKPQSSPSKSLVYTDIPSPSENIRSKSPRKDRPATASAANPGLREIDSNITFSTNSLTRHSDPVTLPSSDIEKVKTNGFTDLIKEVGMGPPPLKRQATGAGMGESKQPTKLARGERGKVEKENVQPMRETRRGGLRSGGSS